MKVINASAVEGAVAPGVELKVLLAGEDARVQHGMLGVVRVEPGVRYPAQEGDYSCHPAEEFSYVISGRMQVWVEGREVELGPGDAMIIHPGERHWVYNAGTAPAEVVWLLTPPIQL